MCVKVYTLHKITIQMTDEYGFETVLHFYHILKRKKTCFRAITSMHTMNAYLNSSFGVRPRENNMSNKIPFTTQCPPQHSSMNYVTLSNSGYI